MFIGQNDEYVRGEFSQVDLRDKPMAVVFLL